MTLNDILHIDKVLDTMMGQYGSLLYVILTLIIFAETGLVFVPFLPGDSLLFAAGALCARPESPVNIVVLCLILSAAAILGDSVNYWIGKRFGSVLTRKEGSKLSAQVAKTHAFYEKHGTKTIVIARFVPIVRTVAPFVAGMGSMEYKKFFTFNVIGGLVWVWAIAPLGYLLGNVPSVKRNFEIVVLAIILISIVPVVIEFMKARAERKRPTAAD